MPSELIDDGSLTFIDKWNINMQTAVIGAEEETIRAKRNKSKRKNSIRQLKK